MYCRLIFVDLDSRKDTITFMIIIMIMIMDDTGDAQGNNNNSCARHDRLTVVMVLSSWQSYCQSSQSSFDEYRTVPGGHRPWIKPVSLSR